MLKTKEGICSGIWRNSISNLAGYLNMWLYVYSMHSNSAFFKAIKRFLRRYFIVYAKRYITPFAEGGRLIDYVCWSGQVFSHSFKMAVITFVCLYSLSIILLYQLLYSLRFTMPLLTHLIHFCMNR